MAPDNRNAEQAATDAYAIWCHQDALRCWNKPRHQEWHFKELMANEEARLAFEAGAASRQGEVDRAEQIVTLAYRGVECVRPIYKTARTILTVAAIRESCGECWGCQLAKAAAEYRGLK